MGARRQRTRSSNGSGSVYKQADGRWVAAVSLGRDEDGKPVRRRAYGRSEAEARTKLIEIQGRYAAGALAPTKGRVPTVKDYLEGWLNRCEQGLGRRRKGVTPETARRYRELMEEHAIPVIGNVQVSKLTAEQVEAMLAAVIAKGRAPRTANHVRTVLRTALNHAVERGTLVRNVAAIAHAPGRADVVPDVGEDEDDHADMHPLDEAEARKLIEKAPDHHDGYLWVFLLSTGLRLSEALGLRWSDFEDDQIAVHRQLKRRKGPDGAYRPILVGYTKTKGSTRTLRLSGTATGALEAQRARQAADRAEAGERWDDSGVLFGLIFRTRTGETINSTNHARNFRRWLVSAKLPSIRVHDLRHTFATVLLGRGIPVTEVSEALGHSKPSITYDVYSHVLPRGREAMARMADSIFTATA